VHRKQRIGHGAPVVRKHVVHAEARLLEITRRASV
jgi:hypothetical protein